MGKLRVVILIPTYNEIENIESLLKELKRLYLKNSKYNFITLIVDDKSPDGTGEVVRRIQIRDKSLHLLSGARRGLGNAMIRGIKFAIGKLKADIVIPNEADFAYPTRKIIYIVKKIEEGYDFVVASRHVGVGKTKGWSPSRELNHFMANTIFATYLAGTYEVKDHNGAFRGMRVKGVLNRVNFDKFPTQGFAFFNYLTFKLTQVTTKIHEFPITYTFRKRGESKVSFNPRYAKTYLKDIVEYIKVCIKIRIERLLVTEV